MLLLMDADLANLKDEILTAYGLSIQEFVPVEGGADAFARRFKGIDGSGIAFFLKVKPDLDPGIRLSTVLNDTGVHEVLAPLPTLDGLLAHALAGGYVIVYPWMEGVNGFEGTPALTSWKQVGTALRRIHETPLPQTLRSDLAVETFIVPDVDRFRALVSRLTHQAPRGEVEDRMATLMKVHRDLIERILEGTAMLGEQSRRLDPEFVPCHTDIHMGNVLIGEDGAVHLIDWDAPRLAPRECDLMFFMDGGILGRHGPDEGAAFFAGYGPYDLDQTLIDYYKSERRLSDLVSFAHEAVEMEGKSFEQKMEALQWFERQLLF